MNEEYLKRRRIAEDVAKKLEPFGISTVIIGSVAYGPESVTQDSDVDLLGLCSFSATNFQEIYSSFGLNVDPYAAQYANSGVINNLSIVFRVDDIEVGLHLWDTSAFDTVTKFSGVVHTFRGDTLDAAVKTLQARADSQVFRSLSGVEKIVSKNPRKVDGGTVLNFYPYVEEEREFFPNIQIYNLLLDPVVLSGGSGVTEGITAMSAMLRKKLVAAYGESHQADVNLFNPLPQKIKDKIPPLLKQRLLTYF